MDFDIGSQTAEKHDDVSPYIDSDDTSEHDVSDEQSGATTYRPRLRRVKDPWSAWLLRLLHRGHLMTPRRERKRQATVSHLMDEGERFDAQE